MKKFTAFILAVLMLLSFTACSGEGDEITTEEPTQSDEAPAHTDEETKEYDPAPDFTVYDKNGNTIKLSDMKGTPVVLNFWASWCPPCKAEMPDFEEAYQAYGEDIQFVMVSHLAWGTDTVEKAKLFYDNSGYTFPIYFDYQFEAYTAYEINSIPKTIFIDENGSIVAEVHQMISRSQLLEYLEKLK